MSDLVRLYRAVCHAEYLQLKSKHRFEPAPGTLQGKWFAESEPAARAWGSRFFQVSGIRHDHIIVIEITCEKADSFLRLSNLDGLGAARYAEIDQLAGVLPREVR